MIKSTVASIRSTLQLLNSFLTGLFFNRRCFFESYFFSIEIRHLFVLNLRFPHRTLARLRYRQFYFPEIIQRGRFADPQPSDYTFSKSTVVKDCSVISSALRKYGCCILDEYFSQSQLLTFRQFYDNYFEEQISSANYSWSPNLHFSPILSEMWFDPHIVNALNNLFRKTPLVLSQPVFYYYST